MGHMITGTVTATPIATEPAAADDTDAPWLTLLRLASPALPVGGFSYSEGLEAGIDHGLVATESEATAHAIDLLHLTLARSDLPALALALQAWHEGRGERALAVNAWLTRTRESAELALQAQQMGRSLLEWLRGIDPDAASRWEAAVRGVQPAPVPTYVSLYALAACACAASARTVLRAYAFGWCENLMQAALKAVPLGQMAGQRMLVALMAQIPAAIDDALARAGRADFADDLPSLLAYSPGQAILSARHETQYSRLFRS